MQVFGFAYRRWLFALLILVVVFSEWTGISPLGLIPGERQISLSARTHTPTQLSDPGMETADNNETGPESSGTSENYSQMEEGMGNDINATSTAIALALPTLTDTPVLMSAATPIPLTPTATAIAAATKTNTPVPTNTSVALPTSPRIATATAVPAQPGSIAKNPIISRGKPTFTNEGTSGAVVDGNYGDRNPWRPGLPSPSDPVWLAIKVGSGPSRLLLNWTSTYNYNYTDTTYGALGNYMIQTSADSTNGADGSWVTVTTVTGNNVKQREHSFDFTGKSWVKVLVTAAAANVNSNGIAIDEIDVHDVSQGAQDIWVFFGDSITADAFDRRASHQPSFSATRATTHPGYFPAMINGAIGGETTWNGLNRIDALLQLNPDAKFIAICYGTNDAAGNSANTAGFQSNMQRIIDKVKAAGKTPVLARIPYAPDRNHNNLQAFNAVIDNLTQANGLRPGPDLYTWFRTHESELSDDLLHPNARGYASINRLWSQAMNSLYQ